MAVGNERIEVEGCDTIPKLFWHQVKKRGNRTAFREKDLGIWRATSWTQYGERASRFVTLYLEEPGGGAFEVSVDGVKKELVDTNGPLKRSASGIAPDAEAARSRRARRSTSLRCRRRSGSSPA